MGRKRRVRYESLGVEIEAGQKEAVWWGRRAFFIGRQWRGRGERELIREREACYSLKCGWGKEVPSYRSLGTHSTT